MKKTLISLGLLAAVAGMAVAFAQTPPAGAMARHDDGKTAAARFDEHDLNHDGKISFAEWQKAEQAQQKQRFDRLDGNHDGSLTQEELQQARQQRRDAMRERRDQRRQKLEQLRALDTDHDQQLSRAEIGDKMPRLSERFDQLDSNHDGKLSRDEMRAGRPQSGQAGR